MKNLSLDKFLMHNAQCTMQNNRGTSSHLTSSKFQGWLWLIDFTLFELKIASAIFLSRRGDQIACDLVGGIFDLHGTANQKDRVS